MKNTQNKTATTKDVKALFARYLKICNKAIAAHKDEFPYQQVLNLGEAALGDRPIDLAIYDDRPKGAFSLHFKDHQLETDGKPEDVKKAWRLNLSYLEKVVANPEDYIKHPEQLDIDWLKSRIGY